MEMNTTTSNDGLSAGSFTQDTRTKWSPNRQLPPAAVDNVSKLQVSVSSELKSRLNLIEPSSTLAGTPRKRRGKRKRRDCVREVKEESENPGSISIVSSTSRCNETTSTSECGQANHQSSSPVAVAGPSTTGAHLVDLIEVFHSFLQNKATVVFRHRLDSQKRARYKRVVKQHRDFEMIKSRISNNSIKSVTELMRLAIACQIMPWYSIQREPRNTSQRFL